MTKVIKTETKRVRAAREAAIDRLLRASRAAKSRRGKQRWNRDELHER